MRRKIFDANGIEVKAGDKVRFSYGIPPVVVIATIISRKGKLIALTPGHNPSECALCTLELHVGNFTREELEA